MALSYLPFCLVACWYFLLCTFFNIIYLFILAGEVHSVKVENILFKGKSNFQEVLVFEVGYSQFGEFLCAA